MREVLFQFFFYLCELLLLWYYMKSFKDNPIKMSWMYMKVIIALSLLCSMSAVVNIRKANIILLIAACIILSMCIKSIVKYKIGMVLSFLVLGMLVELEISFHYACFPQICVVEHDEARILKRVLQLFIHGITIVLLSKIYGNKKIRLKALSNEILIALSLYSIASVSMCTTVWYIANQVRLLDVYFACELIVFLSIMNFFIFLFLIMNISMSVEKLVCQQREITLLNAREASAAEIREKFEYISKIKHNMKNLIVGLLYAVEIGKMDKLAERLEEINVEIDKIDNDFYSCNLILNSILRYEFGRAKYEGISVKSNIFVPADLYLPNGDMENLLGNLLDNAIEACMKVKNHKKYIHVDCKMYHNQLLIKIENSKPRNTIITLETTKENKEEHGLGVPSISEILASYNGNAKFIDHDNSFIVICYLNVNQYEGNRMINV